MKTYYEVWLRHLFVAVLFLIAPFYAAAFDIEGSTTTSGLINEETTFTDLEITGPSGSTTPVKLLVTSGTLEFGSTTGLTFSGGTSGAELYFSGTIANINAALQTLTYTRGSVGSDTLEISLVEEGEVFFPDNGHLYEYIADTSTWTEAEAAAELLSRYGATGYLTTITSSTENSFVSDRLDDAGWMGASDSAVEDVWRWVTGPEAGTQFWQGDQSGSAFGGNYENWNSGEPNDSGSNEDCGQFLAGGSGMWNDLPCTGTTLPGYVVEFGAPGDMPDVASLDVEITTEKAPALSTLTPSDNATDVATTTNLTLEFDEAVATGTGAIKVYRSNDDELITTINASSTAISGGGTDTLVINLPDNLAGNTEYYVIVDDGAFEDLAGIAYAGITSSTTWSFTTEDTIPVLLSLSPADNATGVSITSNLTLTFDKQVGWYSGNVLIRKASDNSIAETVPVGGGPVSGSGTYTLTINPYNDFEYTTNYYVQIASTSIEDQFDNAYGGISDATTWNFRTVDHDGGNGTRVSLSQTTDDDEPSEEEDEETVTTDVDNENVEVVLKKLLAQVDSLRAQLAKLKPGTSASTITDVRDLTVGMEGEDVKKLQEILVAQDTGPAAKELARVTATGFFSTYTKNALGEYQLTHGIEPHVGYFGVITRTQMKAAGIAGLWW